MYLLYCRDEDDKIENFINILIKLIKFISFLSMNILNIKGPTLYLNSAFLDYLFCFRLC